MNRGKAVGAALWNGQRKAVGAALWNEQRKAVGAALWNEQRKAVGAALWNEQRKAVGAALWNEQRKAVGAALWNEQRKAVGAALSVACGKKRLIAHNKPTFQLHSDGLSMCLGTTDLYRFIITLSGLDLICGSQSKGKPNLSWQFSCMLLHSSSSRSSDGNCSLLDEGGSASQVPQAAVEFAGYGSVVWPDSLSERLVDGAGLQ